PAARLGRPSRRLRLLFFELGQLDLRRGRRAWLTLRRRRVWIVEDRRLRVILDPVFEKIGPSTLRPRTGAPALRRTATGAAASGLIHAGAATAKTSRVKAATAKAPSSTTKR